MLIMSHVKSSGQSSAMDLKTKEEKAAELDKRIEALRKKNEALVKRYQVRNGLRDKRTHFHNSPFLMHTCQS